MFISTGCCGCYLWGFGFRAPIAPAVENVGEVCLAIESDPLPPRCETGHALVETKWWTDGKRQLWPLPGRQISWRSGWIYWLETQRACWSESGPTLKYPKQKLCPLPWQPWPPLSPCSIKGSDTSSRGSMSNKNLWQNSTEHQHGLFCLNCFCGIKAICSI